MNIQLTLIVILLAMNGTINIYQNKDIITSINDIECKHSYYEYPEKLKNKDRYNYKNL